MKRKLDTNDVPTTDAPVNHQDQSSPTITTPSFASLNLDPRLLQAVAKSNFTEPTPIQTKAIPLALEGKDILAKSKTGSGKTAAYVLPILQYLLLRKASHLKEKSITILVLVPTRELSKQVTKAFQTFGEFCSKEVRTLNLTQRQSDAVLIAKIQDLPDIVVSTPGQVSKLVSSGALSLSHITKLVIDEADLLLSYDYEKDINDIAQVLSKGIQTFLVSATLTEEVDQLKGIFCRNPAIVTIEEKEEKGEEVTQYVVRCGEEEKWLLVFVIFKLKLVKGKCIIFVADVDRSYRLKLYLEQYGIKSCVLNSELPVNSRLHTVEEFNKGLYDILIAADDQEVVGGVRKSKPVQQDDLEVEPGISDEEEELTSQTNKSNQASRQKDYGISRGIDFQNVSCVLNFDLPTSSKSYTHRIGRTGRARRSGMALSFVIPRSEYGKHKPTSHPTTRHNERTLTKIIAKQAEKGNDIKDYKFDMSQVVAFRYRMNDALRAVTRVAVREARAREIKNELIRSEKLRKHFEDNPEDLRHLSRKGGDGGDLGGGGIVRVQGHLRHVPDYLMPDKAKIAGQTNNEGDISTGKSDQGTGLIAFNKSNNDHHDRRDAKRRKRGSGFRKGGRGTTAAGGRKNDPLKSFRSGRK